MEEVLDDNDSQLDDVPDNAADLDVNKERTMAVVEWVRAEHQSGLNSIYSALSRINLRLAELQTLIADSQHKQHGALTLSLNKCGRGCLGCPHPKWLKWVSKPKFKIAADKSGNEGKEVINTFFAVRTEYPLKVIAHSTVVKSDVAAMYVREAKDLAERKGRMLSSLKQVLRDSVKDI